MNVTDYQGLYFQLYEQKVMHMGEKDYDFSQDFSLFKITAQHTVLDDLEWLCFVIKVQLFHNNLNHA